MSDDHIPFQYLLEVSRTSLTNFIAAQLNKSARSRKHILQIADEWVEARALAMLGEWFSVYGAELIEMAARPPELRHVAERKPEDHVNEKALKPYRYEFWRSEQRHARKRAR